MTSLIKEQKYHISFNVQCLPPMLVSFIELTVTLSEQCYLP